MSTLSTLANTHVRVTFPRINRAALSAGTTVLLIYLFAGLTIQVGVLTQLGISAEEASSWFFVTWMTTGLFSVALALFTRQPVSINLSIPALVFLAGAAGDFSLPQIIGANLVVGAVAIALSALRLTDAFTRLVPPQVALGVFAGSMLLFMSKASKLAVADIGVSGPVIVGFVLVLALTRSHLFAVAAAAASGFLSVVIINGVPAVGDSLALPHLSAPAIAFDLSAIAALGLPILVMTFGIGNLQALAVLRSEGYSVKASMLGLVAGFTTVVNALGGGHAAAIGGSTTAVAAGPSRSRFWAIVLSSIAVVAVALAAVPVIAVVQDMPLSYTLTVGALALVMSFRRVVQKTLEGPVLAGGLTAFTVAALPLQIAGMPMAFWALVAGMVVATAMRPGIAERSRRVAGTVWPRTMRLRRAAS